ncbi:MAG: hypothetical protein AAF721_19665 [Myxococcota bacterium]
MRVLFSSLALCLGCATDSTPESSPVQPMSAQSQLDAPEPATADAVEPPGEPPPPEPEPEPEPEPVVNNDPPTMNLSTFGRCQFAGVSAVGDQVFLHRRGGIHRMGAAGTPVEELPFKLRFKANADDDWDHTAGQFGGVFGRWPDQLFVAADYSMRDFSAVKLARWVDGTWTRVNVLGRGAEFTRAWPWVDHSILAFALAGADASTPRLAVVRGTNKGPKLGGVLGRAGCNNDQWEAVKAIDVSPTGPVTAVVSCATTWVARFAPDDRSGTSKVLIRKPVDDVELALDEHGNGYALARGATTSLFAIKDGESAEFQRPAAKATRHLSLDAEGHLWVVQKDAVFRHDGTQWQRESLPEGTAVGQLAGVEVGVPWLSRGDKSVWSRTPDGVWHAVPLPPAGPEKKIPRPLEIVVPRAGDAWITAQYFKLRKGRKNVGKGMRAIYTQRPVEQPYECDARSR